MQLHAAAHEVGITSDTYLPTQLRDTCKLINENTQLTGKDMLWIARQIIQYWGQNL